MTARRGLVVLLVLGAAGCGDIPLPPLNPDLGHKDTYKPPPGDVGVTDGAMVAASMTTVLS